MNTNPEQLKAISHITGPFICIAGPGSGKTTVIINRVLNLIENGVSPDSILVVTFTKAAAKEMDERYGRLPGAKNGPVFSTIHSFAFNVIKGRYGYRAESIMDESEQKKFLKKLIQDNDIRVKGSDINRLCKNIISDISNYTISGQEISFKPSIHDRQLFFIIYKRYQAYKDEHHLIDYDDMLILCKKAMDEKEVWDRWHRRFKYIMIDEFQDTSKIQADILYRLAAPENNLFISGDDDQSIYAFRNARPDIMLSFERDFPRCGKSYLVTNYRSSSQIIKTANALISNNKVRFDKKISGSREEKGQVILRNVSDKHEQEERLLADIRAVSRKTSMREISVLCRTNREVCLIAKLLSDNDIPFYSFDQLYNIHTTWVCRTLMSYLKIAYKKESIKDVRYISNRPSRYIPDSCISEYKSGIKDLLDNIGQLDKKKSAAVKRFVRDMTELQRAAKEFPSFYDVTEYICEYVNIKKYIRDYCEYAYLDPEDYYDILQDLLSEIKGFADVNSYLEYMDREDEVFKSKMKGDYNGVMVSTMHKAKGLEWDSVFIPSCNYGNTPYIRKNHTEDFTDAVNEEERRLLYVAITRARKTCCLYTYGDIPSSYLADAGLMKKQDSGQTSFESELNKARLHL